MLTRRLVLAAAGLAACAPAAAQSLFATRRADGLYAFASQEPMLDLESAMPGKLPISHFEVLELTERSALLRVVAENGAYGVTACSPNKWREVRPLLERLVLPQLVGRNALELEQRLWRFSRDEYEYAGAPMWNAWGHAECAVLDLIGVASGKRVAELLGGVRRKRIPMYISANQRGGDPAPEIDLMETALAETGCTGVKIKIGARMSRNRDAGSAPGWTESIVTQTRQRLGDGVTIYADANGSFDAPTALGLAPLLEDNGVAMLEEPCPGDDLVMTGQVTRGYRARGGKVQIASGENEGNPTIWRQWIDGDHLDVAQPDPHYGGGLIHCIAVARMAAAAGLKFNPHWPREGAEQAPLIHLCAAAPELWGLQEYRLRPAQHPYGPISRYSLADGHMELPAEPGFGVQYDPAIWKNAVRLSA